MRTTDLHPVHAALSQADRPGHFLCTILNSHPYPIAVSKGKTYGILRGAQSNTDQTFHNPWAIHIVENPITAIEGHPEGWTAEKDQAQQKEQGQRRDWLLEQFKLRESPFIVVQGRLERMEQALTLLLEYSELFCYGDRFGHTTLV